MASYYFKRISDGEKVVARTLKEINARAKREADKFGQAVQVFVDKAERGVGMKSHRQVSMARNPAKKKVMHRNPDAASLMDYYTHAEREKAAARMRAAKAKPKREAKHARRGWQSVAEKISGGAKPYRVKATKAGKSQSYKTMTLREAKDIAQALAENGWRAEVHHA